MKKQALLIPLATVAMLLSCGGQHVIDYKVNQKEFEAAFDKEYAQVDMRGATTFADGQALKFMTYKYSPTACLEDFDVVYNDSSLNKNTRERHQTYTYIDKSDTKIHKRERSYDYDGEKWSDWVDEEVGTIPSFAESVWNIQKCYGIKEFDKAFAYQEDKHYYFGEFTSEDIPGGVLFFLYFEDKQLVKEESYNLDLLSDFDIQSVHFTYNQETPKMPE